MARAWDSEGAQQQQVYVEMASSVLPRIFISEAQPCLLGRTMPFLMPLRSQREGGEGRDLTES